ncbi:hypothetical protein [Lactococcus lactis]|uniref:hypothetical protein n=1 Tax=Lactococcus lactis TaxID=1358 RepID=UPI00101F3C2D|nr:hypothetical protein [Lactococcus lactis]MCL9640769.1 hypothetical protein [Lactococcus lactis]MCT0439762.1 hypothetical protein [Lactococcus lactis subsp. lactis]MCT2920225.1 hypothetical protein [Lactococcus lactis]MDG4974193.1 hypothetical protein [Lactococcus lactis]MDG4990289.1 hypothetical protein [Lactococcus lactis]
MKKFKTKFITLALASAFIAVGYSTAASADSVKSTTPNSTPTISLRSNVEFQGGEVQSNSLILNITLMDIWHMITGSKDMYM